MTEFAREYGDGLYELAKEEDLREELHDELDTLAALFDQEPGFLRLLDSRALSLEQRHKIADDALRGRVHPYVLNFIKLLSERAAASEFGACAQVYHSRFNHDFNRTEALVITAVPLTEKSAEAIRLKLEEVSGKRVTLIRSVDPNVIGGVRVEIDGKRLDNTLQTRLELLRRSLMQGV